MLSGAESEEAFNCADYFFNKHISSFVPTIDRLFEEGTAMHIPLLFGGHGFFKYDFEASYQWITAMAQFIANHSDRYFE